MVDRQWGQWILTYGAGQTAFLQSRPPYPDGNATPVAVGSARIDEVRERGGADRARAIRARISGSPDLPIVVYVPGVFFGNHFRFESSDFRNIRGFEMRRRVAALFNRHTNVRFVYKSFLSQGHDPTLEMLSEACPRCVVVANIPLTDLQWAADALVHEVPSSGMVESLVTDKPLVAFADREVYRMNAQARILLRRRLTLAETEAEFLVGIESMLVSGRFAPVVNPDQEFLRAFVTHVNDGRSAQRAADFIAGLAGGAATPRP